MIFYVFYFCCFVAYFLFGGYCYIPALFSRSLFVCPVGISLDPGGGGTVFVSFMQIMSAPYSSAADCRLAYFHFIPFTFAYIIFIRVYIIG